MPDEISPMNIREAIEVMKIIGPPAERFTGTEEPVKVLRGMFQGMVEDSPVQPLRLVALMEHKAVEDLADEMQEATGADLIERMMAGFARNDLISLVNAAFYLGIATKRWEFGG